MSSATE